MAKKQRLAMRTIILLILAAALVYALYANLTKANQDKVEKNSEAPNFVLTDIDGTKHKLSDYKGQGVVLNFWGTWCKPCEKEMPYMNSQYKEFKDKGVQILAVNVGESNYSVEQFVDKYALDFPVLIDRKSEVQNAYKVDPLPVTFLINKEGKVIDQMTGSLTEAEIRSFMNRIKP
ncbi:peroxiredoxin [Peribacillus deserti]|uniref:Peroxiredoxin n=1 Tax=Peribacillus deserti TaxID=673318 RepID=A0ABS2QQ30_9BACI|nr:thiol-disulfide oxidoreductase ResA [Peribacillus deserti]MBM7694844.1 peroxiredoxin [Peribacillus deserti]